MPLKSYIQYNKAGFTTWLLGWIRLGDDLWRVGPLCGRNAAVMVVDASGDLSGAGNSVTDDSTVELDNCGLGGHGGVTVLHQAPLTAEQDAETPVELWTK